MAQQVVINLSHSVICLNCGMITVHVCSLASPHDSPDFTVSPCGVSDVVHEVQSDRNSGE